MSHGNTWGGSVPDRGNWEGKVLGIGTTRRPDWLELELASVLETGVRCLGFVPSIKEASGEGEQESAMC